MIITFFEYCVHMRMMIKRNITAWMILLRVPNLFIMLLTAIVTLALYIFPALEHSRVDPVLTPFQYALVYFLAIALASIAYVTNDLRDKLTDQLNKKEKSMVMGMSERRTYLWSGAVILMLFIPVLLLSLRVGHLGYSAIYVLAAILLGAYNLKLKAVPLLGNLVIALLTVLFISLPFISEAKALHVMSVHYPAQLAPVVIAFILLNLFAFLLTLIREIVKDAEDILGDRGAGYKTFPVVYGVGRTRQLLLVLSSIYILLIIYMFMTEFYMHVLMRSSAFLLLVIPSLYLFAIIRGARTSSAMRMVSYRIKWIMLMGILFVIMFRIIFHAA